MVAGKVEATSDPASRRSAMERPKSPCSASDSQIRYCCGKGLSRPISRRLASISSIVAFGGSDIAAGSTGNRRSTQNNSAETISNIGNRHEQAARDQLEDGSDHCTCHHPRTAA